MEKHLLLPTQKNWVFDQIRNTGLDPAQFGWNEKSSVYIRNTVISVLVHQTSGYYFQFDSRPHTEAKFSGNFSPGGGGGLIVQAYVQPSFPAREVKLWLQNVKRETEQPDLWATIANERLLLEAGATSDSENQPFTTEEKIKVGQALDEIKKYLLTTQQLNSDQQMKVERQLDYLNEASQRLGRKDWLNILISTVLGTAVNIGLTPDSTRDWFRFAGQIVRQLLGTVISLPSIH